MAKIDKIKLPDGVTYDVIDASKSGVYTVKGTQTKTTASWTGEIDVDALYDGLTIAYYLPTTSKSNVTLTLTLNNGTTTAAIPVYVTGETRMTTHYAAGSTIMLTYWSAGSISVNGTATTSARWTHSDYYISNTDTKVRQTLATGDTNRPLLMSYSNNTDTTANVDNVSYRNNSIYANPSTGTVTATKFVGDISEGTGLTSSQVTTALGYTPIQTESDPTVPSWAKASSKPSYSASEISGLGTAATKDVPSSGNASSTQVVMGSDTRLTNSRPSSDVVQTYSSTSTVPISGKGVAAALATLPSPMVFKGTLGTGGTITALPVNGTATIGDTYKVITAGTYASQSAKVGDVFICQTKTSSANTWAYVPSGDDTVADTWRNIKVNGTEKLGTGISSGAVDFVNGTNTTVNYNATGNKITIDTTYESKTATSGGTDVSLVTTGEKYTWNNKADKSATVSTIAYDTTNKKFTKTINGTTTNVAILATTSVGSASAGTAIPADDITAWTTNTPTEVTPNTVVTGGTTTNIPNIAKKTVVTGVTKKTVVTSCTPATVVTSASGATASVSGCTLTITDGSFSTGASASVTTGDSCTVSTGDSVTVGTPIAAYTSLTTGDACSVTAGTAASLSYTAKSIPNISVSSKTVATGFTTS